MNKKVLAIYFSQSGQLKEIVDNLCAHFLENGAHVEKVQIHLKNEFPFPWTTAQFFSVMPDCVLGKTAELETFTLHSSQYDLVILGYQAWFLSPSIPFSSFMQLPVIKEILKDTPVITVTGARNMWVNALEKIKPMIQDAGGRHVGTIALVDRHFNLVSIFTIFHWMLRGKKDRYLNFFPLPGVSEKDILETKAYGALILPYLQNNHWEGLKEILVDHGAVEPKFHLLFMEGKAGIMFKMWASFINKKENKKFWLKLFKYYLLVALFIFAPIVYIVTLLIFKPFFPGYIKSKIESCLKLN